jgi:uncharacterized protein
MPALLPDTLYQKQFHHRWNCLHDAHVRALAWLLDAPDLLNPHAPQWHGQIATLSCTPALAEWLMKLDREPAALHAYLGICPGMRLGFYAEKLLAFYFQSCEKLVAYSLQVRAGKNHTIGEFDFLLRRDERLVHWEFATKFYLLKPGSLGQDTGCFIGPNLNDTLAAKMHKILDRQLLLSQHPAAGSYLPEPVALAQGLIKGWLFYPDPSVRALKSAGISTMHCHGFWKTLSQLPSLVAERYSILPRLSWLSPARMELEYSLTGQSFHDAVHAHFAHQKTPLLVALLEQEDEVTIEISRGFIVPDDWPDRASEMVE